MSFIHANDTFDVLHVFRCLESSAGPLCPVHLKGMPTDLTGYNWQAKCCGLFVPQSMLSRITQLLENNEYYLWKVRHGGCVLVLEMDK